MERGQWRGHAHVSLGLALVVLGLALPQPGEAQEESRRVRLSQSVGGTGIPRRRQIVRTVGRFNVVWQGTGAFWLVAGLIQMVWFPPSR